MSLVDHFVNTYQVIFAFPGDEAAWLRGFDAAEEANRLVKDLRNALLVVSLAPSIEAEEIL